MASTGRNTLQRCSQLAAVSGPTAYISRKSEPESSYIIPWRISSSSLLPRAVALSDDTPPPPSPLREQPHRTVAFFSETPGPESSRTVRRLPQLEVLSREQSHHQMAYLPGNLPGTPRSCDHLLAFQGVRVDLRFVVCLCLGLY